MWGIQYSVKVSFKRHCGNPSLFSGPWYSGSKSAKIPYTYCKFSRVWPPAKMASKIVEGSILAGEILEKVFNIKYLGIVIDYHLSWHGHIGYVCDKVVKAFLEVCDLPEMETKLIQLKEKAMMHIPDSHVSPSELQHAPWNCFDVPNPLAHFMRVCLIQGKRLLSEEQWEETVNYVLMSWRHVHSIPDLDNLINWAKQNCFKSLAKQCKKALEMMQNSLSEDKCEVFLERMNVAYLQNAAIQPCVDIVGQFLSQLQHSPGEGHSVCSQPIRIE